MIDDNMQWYLDFMKHELEQLKDGNFTGNIEFRVNMKEASIANLNLTLNKSVRRVVKP